MPKNAKNRVKVISVGGSIIIPKAGFNVKFLKNFRQLILNRVKKGERFILVVGGGGTARNYQEALKNTIKLSMNDLDLMGINATWLNAEFVRMMFGKYAGKEVIKNPTLRLRSGQAKPIIIAGGWEPGCSTDYDAVLLAKVFKAGQVINLSNIDYVYDKDPKKFKNAKKIEKISWPDFRKNIVGYKWKAGKNAPFDPIASKEAQKLKLKVFILKGTDLREVEKVLEGKRFKGTIVC